MTEFPFQLRGRHRIFDGDASALPRRLAVIPIEMPRFQLRGMAGKVISEREEVWMLNASHDAQPLSVARLLAGLMLDTQETILFPGEMPVGPRALFLLGNGQLRQGRRKRLPPWAEQEIERIAAVLVETHTTYIAGVLSALAGGFDGGFERFPRDFVFVDEQGIGRVGPVPPAVEVDVSRSERALFGRTGFEARADDYRRNPYLRHLSDAQLAQRTEDIVGSSYEVDANGRLTLDATDPDTTYWLTRLGDVAAEIALRHGPYPAGWTKGMIDVMAMPASILRIREADALGLPPIPEAGKGSLVKYGQRQFLRDVISEGRIRVSPASSYNDPSLNRAIRDDELAAVIDFDPMPLGMQSQGPTTLHQRSTESLQRVRKQLNTNYYVYCLSRRWATRLLWDFDADAAIIIRDAAAFMRRLHEAVNVHCPGWAVRSADVEYYDPLQVNPHEVDLLTWKHFRFAYQREVRLTWVPTEARRQLVPLNVTLGPLTDIAELVEGVPHGSRDAPR